MNARRSDGALVRMYPRAWRARYGAEVADLIAQAREGGARPWRLRADVAKAAGAEHLRAAELAGDAPPRSRARGGVLLVLWAWTLFVLAGTAVQKSSEHWRDAGAGRLSRAAFDILVATSVVGSLLVLAAAALGAPALGRALRAGAWPRLRRVVGVALAWSVAGVAATAGLVTWAGHLDAADRNGGDAAYAGAFLAWAALGAVCLGAWTRVAAAAARNVELSPRVLRAQALLAAGVAGAMLVMTAATLTWRVALASGPTLVPVAAAVAMAAGTVLAAVGARRAAAALPVLS